MMIRIAVLVLALLNYVSCTKAPESRPNDKLQEVASSSLETGFLGLPYYPGSENKIPEFAPGGSFPSVRLTSDSVEKVLSFYKEKLGTGAAETRVSSETIILTGQTFAGKVNVTVEPFEGRTQVMISKSS